MAQLCSRYLEKKLLAFQTSEAGWRGGYRSDDEKYGFLPTPFKRKRKRHLQANKPGARPSHHTTVEQVAVDGRQLKAGGLRDITNRHQVREHSQNVQKDETHRQNKSRLSNESLSKPRRRPSYKRSLAQEFEMLDTVSAQRPVQMDIVNNHVSPVDSKSGRSASLREMYQSSTDSYQSSSMSYQSSGSYYISRDSGHSCPSGAQSNYDSCQSNYTGCQLSKDVRKSRLDSCQSQSSQNSCQSNNNGCQSRKGRSKSCHESTQTKDSRQSNSYPRTLKDVRNALKQATLENPANIVMFVTKQQTLKDTNGRMLQYKAHTGMLVSALYAHTDEHICVRLPNGLTGILSRDDLLPLGVKVSRDFTQQFPDGSSLETRAENEYVNGQWVDEWLRTPNETELSVGSESVWDSSFYSDGTFVTASSMDSESATVAYRDTAQRLETSDNTEMPRLSDSPIRGQDKCSNEREVQVDMDNCERRALLDYLQLMDQDKTRPNAANLTTPDMHAYVGINCHETLISSTEITTESLTNKCQSMIKVSPKFASINRLERSPSSTSIMTRDTESSGYSSSLSSITKTDSSRVAELDVSMVTGLDMSTVTGLDVSTVTGLDVSTVTGLDESAVNILEMSPVKEKDKSADKKSQVRVNGNRNIQYFANMANQDYVSTVNGNVMTVIKVDPVTVNTRYANTTNDEDSIPANSDCDSVIQEADVCNIKLSDITYRPPLNAQNRAETENTYANLPDITQLLKNCQLSHENSVSHKESSNESISRPKTIQTESTLLITSSNALTAPACSMGAPYSGHSLSSNKDIEQYPEEPMVREDTSLITRCGSFHTLCLSPDYPMCCPRQTTALDPGSSSRDISDPYIDQLSSINAASSSFVTSCDTCITSPDSMTSAILQFTSSEKMTSPRKSLNKNKKSKHHRTSTVKSNHENVCSKSNRKYSTKQQYTPSKSIDLLKTIESIETTDSGNWSEVSTDSDEMVEEKHQPRLTAVFDYVTTSTYDVSLRKQDVVTLLNEEHSDWLWVRKETGEVGYIPRTFVVNLETLNLDPYTKTTYL